MILFKRKSIFFIIILLNSSTVFSQNDSTIILNKVSDTLKTENLKEIVISGKKKLIERKIDRTIYNVENSISTIGGDALDALKMTPRINVKNDQISMIGKSGMSVMVDDKLIQVSGDDLINLLKSIPSDNIKSIEVITTPPAKYDAEGNSGIVNIKLKKTRINQWNSSLRSSYTQSTYPKGAFGGSFEYQKNKLSLYSDINYINGSNAPIENTKTYYSDGLWNEGSTRRDYQKSLNTRLGFDYKMNDNWSVGIQYLGNLNKPSVQENILTTIYNPDNSSVNSYLKTLSYTQKKNNNHSINLNSIIEMDTIGKKMIVNFDYFNYKNTENRNFNTIDLSSANNISLQNIENYSTKIDFEHPLKWIILTYGAKVSFTKTNSDANYFDTTTGSPIFDYSQSNVFEYKENTQSFYISGNKKLSNKWESQLGFRLENTQTQGYSKTQEQKNRNDYTKLFPTFYISYTPNEKNSLSINYNKRINRPSYDKLNPFRWYSNPYSYVEGNPFLQPSFTDNVEFNYIHNDNWSNSVYFSHTKNGFEQITILDETTKNQQTTSKNYFNTNIIGFSESYTLKKLKWLSTTFSLDWNYSWSKSLIYITNQNLKGSNTYFSINNDFVLNKNKTLLFNISYWYNFKGVSDLDKNNAYSQLSASIKYLTLDKKLQISLNMIDILKTNKPIYTSYTNNIKIDYDNYYDRRLFRLSLTYKFGNKNINIMKKEFGNEEEKERVNK
ncbi:MULTISPECIES: outer membrane beta-barrel family protein [Empedobacter]|uniref:TonB-dependent receptor n=2 Tax=Empedobacter TaxID=59734 RepID=A0A427BP51_9FLAO|nr:MULTISPECIES: outer membrane beta-barrel family protein [Empedobacter]MDH0675790.1 TonB-dependent receptor [Empedobacter sp. GD03861]RRT91737.1 TonB-dependent receptor [Empedobacter falsenii]RRT91966.1 TonB-dependent receptor [Empedobacter falsenii]